jgi:hypothetical protein
MTNPPKPAGPSNYRIRVSGKVKESWSEWFNGMTIDFELEAGEVPVSILSGTLPDQSALYGVLGKIRNLGLKLLSVEQINTKQKNDKEEVN